MRIRSNFLKKYAIVTILSFTIYGCSSSLPEATDDQLIEFFTHGIPHDANEKYKVISHSMLNCLAVLSNARFTNYEVPPYDLANSMRVECQKSLLILVNNKNVNLIGFKMHDFENKQLAERIYHIRESGLAANEQYRIEEIKKAEEKRKQQEQELEKKLEALRRHQLKAENDAKQKVINKLTRARNDYAAFVTKLNTSLPQLRAICDEYIELTEQIKRVDEKKSIALKWRLPQICKKEFSQLQSEAHEILDQWNRIEVKGEGTYWTFNQPTDVTLGLNNQIAYATEILTNGIIQMKTILAQ